MLNSFGMPIRPSRKLFLTCRVAHSLGMKQAFWYKLPDSFLPSLVNQTGALRCTHTDHSITIIYSSYQAYANAINVVSKNHIKIP